MKIKIAVTGGNGQVGNEIRILSLMYPSYDFTFLDIEDFDLTNQDAVQSYFANKEFHFLINCAAYTAVDKAEEEAKKALQINAHAVKLLTVMSLEKHIRLIHISTDYVFSGDFNQPIGELTVPNPLSVYGKTKLKGEEFVLKLPDSYIVRTAWVYSTFGKDFVKSILHLARQRNEIGVVADQIGSPTYARDLASAILQMIDSIVRQQKDEPGIYHYSNEGVISWYDFAYFIVNHFGINCKVKPITTEEYRTLAARPRFSALDKTKIKKTFGIEVPHWSESLRHCLDQLGSRAGCG